MPGSATWRSRWPRRGIRLVLAGDRVELATAPEAGALIARYVGADAVRLSPASLETLAIVAYRQPVAKSAIERIRGVDSDYTIRSLLHRRLVVELGRSDAPGRPFLYGTGFEFLERFGLTSLDELPPLDVDVAARLAEEGGVAVATDRGDPGDGSAPESRLMPPERLQKVLAAAGVASRRASEDLIAAGRVTVDGRRATLGQQVEANSAIIEVDGLPIGSAARTTLPPAPQAGRRDVDDAGPPRRDDGPRPPADGPGAGQRPPVSRSGGSTWTRRDSWS